MKPSCGTIRWFDARRGFGFIIPDGGGPDVFLHRKILQRSGLRRIAPGARVRYEAEETAAGIKATWIELNEEATSREGGNAGASNDGR